LRRSTFLTADSFPASTANTFSRIRSITGRFPPFYGYSTNGVHSAKGTISPATTYGFNFVTVSPYHWLAPMFVGQRGSMVWQYNADTTGSDSVLGSVKAMRVVGTRGTPSWLEKGDSGVLTLASSTPKFYIGNVTTGAAGLSMTNQNTQTGMAVHLPDYNRFRMRYIYPNLNPVGTSNDDTDTDSQRIDIIVKPSGATKAISNITLERYFSIGTDFNFLFFLNCPSYYILASPTAA